jgi:hypothetical protein
MVALTPPHTPHTFDITLNTNYYAVVAATGNKMESDQY